MATHLTQLTTLAWAPVGTGATYYKYAAGNISLNMLKGNMLDNVTLAGIPGPFRRIAGPRFGELTFTTYPCGPATTPLIEPYDGDLIKAVGLGLQGGSGFLGYVHFNGTTYQQVFHRTDTYPTGSITPVSFKLYIDQLYQTMTSAVGNMVLKMRAGEIVSCDWAFTGLYSSNPTEDISDGGTGDEAYGYNSTGLPNYAPVPCLNVSAAIGGTGGITSEITEISVDLGNTIVLRPDITNDGFNVPIITKTEPILTFVVEQPQLGTGGIDFWQQAIDADLVTVTATFGNGAADAVTVDFSGYFNDYPEISESDGRLLLTGRLLEDPDNPFTLTY